MMPEIIKALSMFSRIARAVSAGRAAFSGAAPKREKRAPRSQTPLATIGRERSWDATKSTRLTGKLLSNAKTQFADAIWSDGGERLRNIGRYLVREHPEAAAIVDYLASVIVGRDGIWPRFDTGDETLDAELNRRFSAWAENCDARGEEDWASIQRLWVREISATGEAFTETGAIDGAFVLSPFESENLGFFGSNSNIINGIEYDERGRKVAYYVTLTKPGPLGVPGMGPQIRIPAERVLHIMMRNRPSQFRGESAFDATAITLYDIFDADRAEMDLLRAAAYFGLIIRTNPEQFGEIGATGGLGEDETNSDGYAPDTVSDDEMMIERGVIRAMADEVKAVETNNPTGEYQSFTRALRQAIAARWGIPYSAATGDTSQANYSSERAAEMHARPRYQCQQWMIIRKGARPAVKKWIEHEVARKGLRISNITIPEIVSGIHWRLPHREWVDPGAEAQKLKTMVELGLLPFPAACEYVGRDARDVLAEHKRALDLAEASGVSLPPAYSSTLFQYHIEAGALTINEIRKWLKLEPVEWGEKTVPELRLELAAEAAKITGGTSGNSGSGGLQAALEPQTSTAEEGA